MLRGAFVGFGNVAEKGHALGWRAHRSDVEIVAATDAAPSRREAFLAAFPGGRWHDTPASLLSGERLDFVDILGARTRNSSFRRSTRVFTF
jgi:predicted dehydrogenase